MKSLEKEGFEITYLPVDEKGFVKFDVLEKSIREDTILISVIHGNNEIGVIQDIEKIGKLAKEKGVALHIDAVQTTGKVSIEAKKWNVDMFSFSGHKFYGPKGIGGLYIRNGIKLEKVLTGGHQERNRRPGTENVAGIVGMAKALEISYENMEEEFEREKILRDKLEKSLLEKIPESFVNGNTDKRLAGTLSFSIKYVEGESILLNLDIKGIAVSSGSACTSASLDPSHVILALGVPIEFAHGTIRFSIGRFNTEEEIDYVIEELPKIVEKIRSLSPFWNK
jgi:cysteine desulfurase